MKEIDNVDFAKLIKNEGYQVFLLTCPSPFPFNFARHSWFVVVENGNILRAEILFRKNRKKPQLGKYLHFNSFKPFEGASVFFTFDGLLWNSKLLHFIEGGEKSLAQDIFYFIKNSYKTYRHRNKYSPLGPNCNTFVQWVLDNFPDFKAKLPNSCLGKNYNRKIYVN